MVAPPHWLSAFANSVATHIHSVDLLSPLGCHFQNVDEVWEVTVFASRTEIVGGPEDGRMSDSGFNVDVKNIIEQFSQVESISWQTQPLGLHDELGAHLAIEGLIDNKQVWLRVTAAAPRRFAVGRRALVNQQKLEELW